MDFIDSKISEYAEAHTDQESELLAYINRDTYANVLIPRMLSGQLQGRILSMISKMVSPKVILEIGTYTGYSALCLGEGLAEGGELHTIEINEELKDRVLLNFDQSYLVHQMHLHIGKALDIIPRLPHPDLVFIDADKENYLNYYKLIMKNAKPGMVLIADNVLWSGKVLNESDRLNDEETKALHEFNEFVQKDNFVENVLFPVRDGLMVIRVR